MVYCKGCFCNKQFDYGGIESSIVVIMKCVAKAVPWQG